MALGQISLRGLPTFWIVGRMLLKCDDTRAETRFRLSAKLTSPFKSAGASVQSTTGSRGVRISVSNAGYTVFRGGVKSTGYPLHSPVSPSLPFPCVTVCHHVSPGLYTARFSNSVTPEYKSRTLRPEASYWVTTSGIVILTSRFGLQDRRVFVTASVY
jgi:hypothetical protein